MKKLLCLAIVVFLLAGCSTKANLEVERLEKELTTIKNELDTAKSHLDDLNLHLAFLEEQTDVYNTSDGTSFKGTLFLDVLVLDKRVGDDLYPYYVVVTLNDRDHNTPLLLTIESQKKYEEIQVGENYAFKVYVASVIELENNNVRFVFSILDGF